MPKASFTWFLPLLAEFWTGSRNKQEKQNTPQTKTPGLSQLLRSTTTSKSLTYRLLLWAPLSGALAKSSRFAVATDWQYLQSCCNNWKTGNNKSLPNSTPKRQNKCRYKRYTSTRQPSDMRWIKAKWPLIYSQQESEVSNKMEILLRTWSERESLNSTRHKKTYETSIWNNQFVLFIYFM